MGLYNVPTISVSGNGKCTIVVNTESTDCTILCSDVVHAIPDNVTANVATKRTSMSRLRLMVEVMTGM